MSVTLFPNTTCLKDKVGNLPRMGHAPRRRQRPRYLSIRDNHFKASADAAAEAVEDAEDPAPPVDHHRARKVL